MWNIDLLSQDCAISDGKFNQPIERACERENLLIENQSGGN
jgi:hypothetical protein